MERVLPQLDQITKDRLVELRRILHLNPEVSGDEFQTKERIRNYLIGLEADEIVELGKTGIAGRFVFGEPKKRILFRAELDALPIQEINDFAHRSKTDGVSHKCGHDGHMAILCALGELIKEQPPKDLEVILLFQPAEENGEGAVEVVESSNFESIKPDAAIALHNLPGFPLNQVVCKNGSFTPAVKSVIYTLNGKTSHAAEPENGINPASTLAKILLKAEDLSVTDIQDPDFVLFTPVYTTMGEKAYGISAGYAEVHLTIRSWTNERMNEVEEQLTEIVRDLCKETDISLSIDYLQEFSANENNTELVDIVRKSTNDIELDLFEKNLPFKWGEDFGLFSTICPSVMFGLGSGESCPALHNPDYDFPEELIFSGSKLFHCIMMQFSS